MQSCASNHRFIYAWVESASQHQLFAYLIIMAISLGFANSASAQRVRFTQSTPVPSAPFGQPSAVFPNSMPSPPVFPSTVPGNAASGPLWQASPGTMIPIGPPLAPNNSGGFATPNFDPFSPTIRPNSSFPTFPNYPPANPFGVAANPMIPGLQQPTGGMFPNSYPNSVYPSQAPPALFPGIAPNGWGSNGSGFSGSGWNGQSQVFPNSWFPSWNQGTTGFGNGWLPSNPQGPMFSNNSLAQPFRFFMGPRLRHSWIQADDDQRDMEVNDTDASLVFALPGFFGSPQPIYLIPSFSIHTWEGPRQATSDIPGSAYSAFLDVGWDSDPNRTFGLETGVRVGVFTDFNTFTSESIRTLGKLLGRIRLTPNATLRAGAYYVDRNRIKIVPAGGILWTPNQDTRFDIFFPEPKLAHYLSTLGNTDMWWYVTGYFGGGSWTVTRASGDTDSIDINDLRIALGLEWGRNDMMRQGRRIAFVEAGYAFDRELRFRYRPQDNIDIEDGLTVRAGFGY